MAFSIRSAKPAGTQFPPQTTSQTSTEEGKEPVPPKNIKPGTGGMSIRTSSGGGVDFY